MSTLNNLEKIYKKSGLSRSKAVEQYDLNNNLIKIWKSITDINKTLQYSSGCISLCCNGKKQTYNNYIWKFSNDPNLDDNEIWKKVFDNEHDDLFISNYGRYFSKKMNKSFGTVINNNMVLEYHNNTYTIANLVLKTFVGDKPSDKYIICHIDKNSKNNKLTNLCWVLKNTNIDFNYKKSGLTQKKQIVQLKDNIIINTYNSLKEAHEKTNINIGHISECANNKRKSASGFTWDFIIDNDINGEIWKLNINLNLFVSNKGRILSRHGKTYGYLNKNGYYSYSKYKVHKLVAETFINNPDNKKTVDHINGDTKNNCIENLRWATIKEQLINRGHEYN